MLDDKKHHLTVKDFAPIAKSMSIETFVQRYPHPFLFGREVLEEEFQFATQVAMPSMKSGSGEQIHLPPVTDIYRIRHWIIPVQKPAGAAVQERVFLGRAENNDIYVPHKTVSKLHAYFVRDADVIERWFLVDTGSANGTKANGMAVKRRSRVVLADGDTVAFGRCVFQWMSSKALHARLQTLSR